MDVGSCISFFHLSQQVLQDKRFKNRELQIMRMLVTKEHPNIVRLKHCFYSNGDKVPTAHNTCDTVLSTLDIARRSSWSTTVQRFSIKTHSRR